MARWFVTAPPINSNDPAATSAPAAFARFVPRAFRSTILGHQERPLPALVVVHAVKIDRQLDQLAVC